MSGQKKLPWMKFWGFDFFNSAKVQAMSNAELGAYMRLLWLNFCDGGIPDNTDELRGICRMDGTGFAAAWPRLNRCFTEHPDREGFLTNPRVMIERGESIAFIAGQSRKGKLSAEKRHPGSTAVKPELNRDPTISESESESEKNQSQMGEAAAPPPPTPPASGKSQRGKKPPAETPRRNVIPPDIFWVMDYAESRSKPKGEAQRFHDHHTARGWKLRSGPMLDWEAAWRTWEFSIGKFDGGKPEPELTPEEKDFKRRRDAAMSRKVDPSKFKNIDKAIP